MTSLSDRIVDSLRVHHDRLADLVASLTDDQLTGPSGATQWRLCDVLSHLGSGAEIMVKPLQAAIEGVPAPAGDNEAIWARWNAATPREQATWFVHHDAVMVETVELLPGEQLEALRVDLGFLPEPVPFVVSGGMRLNEVAQHTWDVLVGLDPAAGIDAEAAEILLDLFAGPLSFMLGFSAKVDALTEPAVIAAAGRGLNLSDQVAVESEAPIAPTATLTAPAEAVVRLLGGRLTAAHTAQDITITGNVTLDDLRQVFPGY
ncbi:maleylpyruvate isomerase family mycothiol-dependent enzyme [soil metagenome]